MGFVGIIVVLIAVFGGFLFMGGKMAVILKAAPGELFIIGGAAFGALIVGNMSKTFKSALKMAANALKDPGPTKEDYADLLVLMYELLSKLKKEGPNAITADIEKPESSPIFKAHPRVTKNHHAVTFLCDSLKAMQFGGMDPYDFEEMLDIDIKAQHQEEHEAQHALQTIADSFPGLGIVAAVLGIVKTMEYLTAGTEVIGKSVAGALVGTMLGVFLAYGLVGPIANKMKSLIEAQGQYLKVIKVALLTFHKGLPPRLAIEFARREVPPHERPGFEETESMLKKGQAKAA